MRYDSRYQGRQRYAPNRGQQSRAPRRSTPVAMTILADVFAAALLLLVFYITNYVITPDVEGTPLAGPSSAPSAMVSKTDPPVISSKPTHSASAGQPSSSPTGTQQQTASATPTPAPLPGMFRSRFPDKFTSGTVEKTDTSYKSANVNVSYKKIQDSGVIYYVADIYVADLKYFKTGFAKESSKPGSNEHVDSAMKALGGIIGVNGDNCMANPSLLIRNGVFFNKWSKSSSDEFVMYNDGTMKAFPANQFDWNQTKTDAPYQVWGFGPMLLDNGQPMTKFNSTVNKANPRSAIGYYEPGHYCLVTVDGRQTDSSGYSTAQLSNLFYSLGCKEAFNLDGGGSAQMVFMGNLISSPCSDYRPVDDFIYIADN